MARRKHTEAVRITSASRSHGEDVAARQRRYLLSMGIRTACFVLAVVFRGTPLMWVFIVGAFVLPYVAVVAANAGAATDPGGPEPFEPDATHKAIEPPTP